jgi:hypothetical protein
VLQLVGLYAPSWNDDDLRGTGWLGAERRIRRMLQGIYGLLPGFLTDTGAASDEAAIIERVAQADSGPLFAGCAQFSLIHVDYRPTIS